LSVKGSFVVKHPSNKYAVCLISVNDADLSPSPRILASRQAGEVFEEKSHIRP